MNVDFSKFLSLGYTIKKENDWYYLYKVSTREYFGKFKYRYSRYILYLEKEFKTKYPIEVISKLNIYKRIYGN